MNNAENVEKILKYQKTKDQTLKNEIVSENLFLVKKLIAKYAKFEEYDDYLQEGLMGLSDAIEIFDPSISECFSTIAAHYIMGYVQKYRDEHYKGMGIGRTRDWNDYEKVMNFIKNFPKKRTPTNDEIAEGLGISIKRVETVKNIGYFDGMHSFDKAMYENQKSSNEMEENLQNFVGKDENMNSNIFQEEVSGVLLSEIRRAASLMNQGRGKNDGMDEQRYDMFCRYFGIGEYTSTQTYKEIADYYNCTKQNVNNTVGRMMRILQSPETKRRIRESLAVENDVRSVNIVSNILDYEL